MGATTNKAVFDSVYSPFRVGYDWTNYVKNVDNKQYYVAVDMVPKVPTNRIPYYNYNKQWIDKAAPDGYLPANHSTFYFQMRPLSITGAPAEWLRLLVLNTHPDAGMLLSIGISVTSMFNKLISLFKDSTAVRNTRLAAVVTLYDTGARGYRTVVVPVTDEYFTFKCYAFDSKVMEEAQANIKQLDAEFKAYVLSLEKLYNKTLTITGATGYGAQSPVYRGKVQGIQNLCLNRLAELQQNPDYLVKVCKDCQGNARIGNPIILPLVYTLAAVAIALIAKGILSKYVESRQYIAARKQEIDRETAALQNIQSALANPNLSPAQKDAIIKQNSAVITDAQGNINTQDASLNKPGFFDRMENWGLAIGLFLLGNTYLKTRNGK